MNCSRFLVVLIVNMVSTPCLSSAAIPWWAGTTRVSGSIGGENHAIVRVKSLRFHRRCVILIRRLSREPSLWGAPRAHGELGLLAIEAYRIAGAKHPSPNTSVMARHCGPPSLPSLFNSGGHPSDRLKPPARPALAETNAARFLSRLRAGIPGSGPFRRSTSRSSSARAFR